MKSIDRSPGLVDKSSMTPHHQHPHLIVGKVRASGNSICKKTGLIFLTEHYYMINIYFQSLIEQRAKVRAGAPLRINELLIDPAP
jgi:hypothetical protein